MKIINLMKIDQNVHKHVFKGLESLLNGVNLRLTCIGVF